MASYQRQVDHDNGSGGTEVININDLDLIQNDDFFSEAQGEVEGDEGKVVKAEIGHRSSSQVRSPHNFNFSAVANSPDSKDCEKAAGGKNRKVYHFKFTFLDALSFN